MRLQDQVAVITGAGNGIGRASALLFPEGGTKVVVADCNATGAERTLAEIERQGRVALWVRADISKGTDAERLPATRLKPLAASLGRHVSPSQPTAILENGGVIVTDADVLEAYNRLEVVESTVEALVNCLGADYGDLWDSGRVVSDQSTNIVYAGRPLESRQHCWWKVRIWDQDGQRSRWSEPSMWSMGLLYGSDWIAKWIGLDSGDETRPEDPSRTRLPARMLRREFEAEQQIKRATVYVSGLGFFDLYINGAKVGDHIMDPALT